MKRWIVLCTIFGLAGPSVLPAQSALTSTSDRSGLTVRVTPRVGVMTPADWFYEEFAHFGTDPVEWTEAAILRAPVAGLAVELEFPGTGLWIRGEVMQTFDAITSMTHAVLFETNGFDPPRVVRTPYRVATAMTIGSVDLAFPTQFRLGPVQPYVTAGAGGKRYSFDTDPFQELDAQVVLPQPGVVPTANVGAGFTAEFLGITMDLQVRDALSLYWERLQHDVMFFAGATWTLF